MTVLVVLLIIIAAVLVLYLLAIRPNTSRKQELRPFEERCVAHRGLFDNQAVPENSMPAFRRAIEAGYAIELDVQLTTDDRLVVFHDDRLQRMCGDPRKIYEVSWEGLKEMRLLGTDEGIPLFEDVLALIDGRVPLVMELKPDGRYLETAERASKMLKSYPGPVCLESFHPLILSWYRKNDPRILRGLLSTEFSREENSPGRLVGFLLTNLLLNFVAKPDFISYNHRYRNQFSYWLCRLIYRPVNAAWTIRSQADLEEAREVFSIMIFEGFIPE